MALTGIREKGSAAHRVAGATFALLLAVLFAAVLFAAVGTAHAEEEEAWGTAFDSPEAGAKALIAAVKTNDDAAMKALFGPNSEDLVLDGKDPAVAKERADFVKTAEERLDLEKAGEGMVVLVLGKNQWPLPVPLVEKDGKWYFDAEAGRDEIIARRIGRNEFEAIAICQACAVAQAQYASADHDGDEVSEYAQKLVSTPGQQDGLYWETDPESDAEMSPLGPLVAPFAEYLKAADGPVPYNGYYWKILKGQGPNAPGGAHSYVINGNMIAGFALVGVPARYLSTGVMTFLVSNHGKILEKDLGEKSLEIVKAMEVFDPDDTWKVPAAD